LAPSSPEVYLAQRDSQRQVSLSGTRLFSPDEEGASYDELMGERAKVSAIEAIGIMREQEYLMSVKRAAAVPDRQWPSETVCQSRQCRESSVDP